MTHAALAPAHVAVVTGAASGIGLAAARRFAGMGLRGACRSRRRASGRRRAEVAAVHGGRRVLTVPTDVSSRAEVQRLEAAVLDRLAASMCL